MGTEKGSFILDKTWSKVLVIYKFYIINNFMFHTDPNNLMLTQELLTELLYCMSVCAAAT